MKRAVFMSLVALAMATNSGCSEYNREAVEDNNQGMGMLRAGRMADARDRFQRAADEDPKFDQPLYNLALVHMRQDQWAPAAEALTRAIARNPRNAEYHFQLGNAQFAQEHWEDARRAFTQATQVNPNFYMAYVRLGEVAEKLDEPQAALTAYTAAITKAPRAYRAYVRLGRAYYRVHDYERATTVLREGLRITPEGAIERGAMHNILGNVLLEQNQRPQAIDEFLAANREDPELAEALFSAGYTCSEIPERRQQAILYLQRFVEARGGSAPREYLDIAQNKLAELQATGAH
ncbi:MAG: tetratricopeptide repeat protein [Myxococcales bacterium]|nr:tetratricopeptide repeat protein [Myxococcales bacterium]